MRFEQKTKGLGEFKRGTPNPTVNRIVMRIQRAVEKQMREKGGTAFSIIRRVFLNWDADASGEMSKSEVVGALKMLGMNISDSEASSLVQYYDLEGDGEMKYQPLVEDVTKASPHFLSHPDTARLRREEAANSSRRGLTPESGKRKEMPRVCQLFLKKLKNSLLRSMREKGGTEFSILRTTFLNWDADKSGEIGVREFQGAMSKLGLKVNDREAKIIVDFYDVEGDGEMKYEPLVKDVTRGNSNFLVYEEDLSRDKPPTATENLALQEQRLDDDAMFSARLRRRPPNAVVEAFKSKLRNKLEMQMRASGGTIYSICRECFLMWDGDCSGELNVREFTGAIRRMGLDVTDSDAKQIVAYYDLEGDGEMRYQELVSDIVQGVPHFMTHPKTPGREEKVRSSRGPEVKSARNASQDIPKAVLRIQAKIKEASESAAEKSGSKISGEDLFYGTCIRFDNTTCGRLTQDELAKVFKEIKCNLGSVEIRHLVGWWDIGAEGIVKYRDLVHSIFPRDKGGGISGGVNNVLALATARSNSRNRKKGPAKGMNFKSAELTARAKRAGVLAEKAQIERRIKELMRKEKMLSKKL